MDNLCEYTKDRRVVDAIGDELNERLQGLIRHGVLPWRLWGDPGVGFAKTTDQSLRLITHTNALRSHLPTHTPLLIGFSRKRYALVRTAHMSVCVALKHEVRVCTCIQVCV